MLTEWLVETFILPPTKPSKPWCRKGGEGQEDGAEKEGEKEDENEEEEEEEEDDESDEDGEAVVPLPAKLTKQLTRVASFVTPTGRQELRRKKEAKLKRKEMEQSYFRAEVGRELARTVMTVQVRTAAG
jgi:hypothetical protein